MSNPLPVFSGFRAGPCLCAAVGLALLVGCATPTQSDRAYAVPKGVDVLSEGQLTEIISGNSMSGVSSGGNEWARYHAADGSFREKEAGADLVGEWRISGSFVCYDYQGLNSSDCNTMVLEEGHVRLFNQEGKPNSRFPSASLAQGNPYEL